MKECDGTLPLPNATIIEACCAALAGQPDISLCLPEESSQVQGLQHLLDPKSNEDLAQYGLNPSRSTVYTLTNPDGFNKHMATTSTMGDTNTMSVTTRYLLLGYTHHAFALQNSYINFVLSKMRGAMIKSFGPLVTQDPMWAITIIATAISVNQLPKQQEMQLAKILARLMILDSQEKWLRRLIKKVGHVDHRAKLLCETFNQQKRTVLHDLENEGLSPNSITQLTGQEDIDDISHTLTQSVRSSGN